MAKNKLNDATDHLFMQLERLNDDTLTDEEVERECKKAQAMQGLVNQIMRNEQLKFDVIIALQNGSIRPAEIPDSLGIETSKQL